MQQCSTVYVSKAYSVALSAFVLPAVTVNTIYLAIFTIQAQNVTN
jgi:hypothetical protein